MIELLQLGNGEGWSQLRSAVEQALGLGCHDVAAIRHLMVAAQFDSADRCTYRRRTSGSL